MKLAAGTRRHGPKDGRECHVEAGYVNPSSLSLPCTGLYPGGGVSNVEVKSRLSRCGPYPEECLGKGEKGMVTLQDCSTWGGLS